MSVECDGVDITPKLRQHKIHSVLFLNIQCFGSGTRPWNSANGCQKLDDGLIEVVGLTTYQLPLLQAGGTGHCITQCKVTTGYPKIMYFLLKFLQQSYKVNFGIEMMIKNRINYNHPIISNKRPLSLQNMLGFWVNIKCSFSHIKKTQKT